MLKARSINSGGRFTIAFRLGESLKDASIVATAPLAPISQAENSLTRVFYQGASPGKP